MDPGRRAEDEEVSQGNITERSAIPADVGEKEVPKPKPTEARVKTLSIDPAHLDRRQNDGPAVDFVPRSKKDLDSRSSETLGLEGGDEDPPEPVSFQRSSSPTAMHRVKGAAYEKASETGFGRMHKVTLYETSTRFYLIGGDVMDKQFRVLKIDRTAPPGQLVMFEDDIVYSKREMNQLLNAIDDGNKGAGGMKQKSVSWGLLGFIRFTESYYMLLITKRAQVAMIGGHYIYKIDGTQMIPLTTGSTSRFQRDRNPEEARFLGILNNLDMTRSFYFSYSYNITRSLQQNIIRERESLNNGFRSALHSYQDMFVWNHHLLQPAHEVLKSTFDWCLPIIHGFIDQSAIDVFGRRLYITVIARRSRFFAGARFLKRGANDLGYVANDVETEQIVSEVLTTSFHAPGPRLYANPTYTSYVQHRGSIPLYWTQDNSGVTPKPSIDLNLIDPFYTAAALHFDNLFERYGTPVYALNLVKSRERTPRESKLLSEYQNALSYLNQTLPEGKKIIYDAFDMSRASKTRGQDVIGILENIAERILDHTGFFHNGDEDCDSPKVQNGVARTNCIDCLDRTNAAQFVISKRALGRQLQALGVILESTVEYDTDIVNIFTHMFHDHGDTIAIQYGGSHLVNTMATYRKLNHWQSHSRDMVESFKRYYHNSFLDSQRQEAYNLFLGNYIWAQGQPMLWDLTTDYYLHHTDPRGWLGSPRRSYIQWFTPEFLEPRTLPPYNDNAQTFGSDTGLFDDYWLEYYRPLALSSFLKIFSFRKSNESAQIFPEKLGPDETYDLSPFRPRKTHVDPDTMTRKPMRKGVTILDPQSFSDTSSREQMNVSDPRAGSHTPVSENAPMKQSILRESQFGANSLPSTTTMTSKSSNPGDKSLTAQWTLNQIYTHSLNPSVTPAEADEYEAYVTHPQNLPLVVSADIPEEAATLEFFEYVNSVGADAGVYGDKSWYVSEEDVADYRNFLHVEENPLDITEEDGGKKRYKAYRQWLRGKSLFKQSKVDPEYKATL